MPRQCLDTYPKGNQVMFPGPGAQIIRNEAGEPIGWDYPGEPEYCDECGGSHAGTCQWDPYAEPDEEE
jgi:hypothetical protein